MLVSLSLILVSHVIVRDTETLSVYRMICATATAAAAAAVQNWFRVPKEAASLLFFVIAEFGILHSVLCAASLLPALIC